MKNNYVKLRNCQDVDKICGHGQHRFVKQQIVMVARSVKCLVAVCYGLLTALQVLACMNSNSSPVQAASSDSEIAASTDSTSEIAGLKQLLDGDFRDGNGGSIKPYETGAKGRNVDCPADLSCPDFSNCKWSNAHAPVDNVDDFVVAKGNGAPNRWAIITGTDTFPVNNYLLVGSNRRSSAADNAQFYSDPIACQNGDGTLSLDYWLSPSTILDVCVRQPPSDTTLRNCQTIGTGRSFQRRKKVTIPSPGGSQPFSIVFVAKSFIHEESVASGGIAVIDDLTYTASDCENKCGGSKPPVVGSSSNNVQSSSGSQPEFCSNVVCNFDDPGALCVKSAKLDNWQVSERAAGLIGNPLTGIRSDGSHGGYIYTESKTPSTFTTPEFSMPEDGLLTFLYYKATKGTSLYVCDNSDNGECDSDNAVWKAAPFEKTDRRWKQNSGEIPLAKGKHRISITADQAKSDNGYMGIDSIDIKRSDGSRSFC